MNQWQRHSRMTAPMHPVDIVLAPAWWHANTGLTFDRDFFFHPVRRVESERIMERTLYEKWGRYGVGEQRDEDRPEVGPVHLAAGYIIQEMLGCRVDYTENQPPQVITANREDLSLDVEAAFESRAFKDFLALMDGLQERYGYLFGDINWSGVLNIALDLRGQAIFMDMLDRPTEARAYFDKLAVVIERFVETVESRTGTSSISVNRTVRHIREPVFLHSECSHTMISVADYEGLLMQVDAAWMERHRPYGIHFCGADPHRFASSFSKLPSLDFLDVGWGGNVKVLREHLPATFLNIRLSPVEIIDAGIDEIRRTIRRLVHESGNPWLTGVCCVNMDEKVSDDRITAIFDTVEELRREYASGAE